MRDRLFGVNSGNSGDAGGRYGPSAEFGKEQTLATSASRRLTVCRHRRRHHRRHRPTRLHRGGEFLGGEVVGMAILSRRDLRF